MQISATVGRQLSVVCRNLEPNSFMQQDMQMTEWGKTGREKKCGSAVELSSNGICSLQAGGGD